MAIIGIQFTQDQARTLAGVSPGDLRHWRKAVAYLAQKSGKAARFSFADLIALAAAAELSDVYGVRIRVLGPGMDALFRKLAETRATQLEGLFAIVTHETAWLQRSDDLSRRWVAGCSLLIPFDPIIERIKAQMLPFEARPHQTALPFLPQEIKAG